MQFNTQEAEKAVIAVLLYHEEHTDGILTACRAEMFTDPDCRKAFEIAQKLSAEGKKPDITAVAAATDAETGARLVAMTTAVFYVPANIDTYIRSVREAWQYRRAASGLRDCLDKAQKHENGCFDEICRLPETVLGGGEGEETKLGDSSEEAMAALKMQQTGITTGFTALDASIGGGIVPGRLTVIGGRPGMGKSALALNMAINAARAGAVVLYISFEMTTLEVCIRALTSMSSVTADAYRSGDKEAVEKMLAAAKELSSLRIVIRDAGESTFAAVAGACRRIRAQEGRLDLVVIDYVGLMRTEKSRTSTRQQEIAEICHGLKRLAVEMPTSVLLLSQLNREPDNRTGHVPRLSELRESGDLEQDADVVLFPVRNPDAEPDANLEVPASLYVAKNRSGDIGAIRVRWKGCLYTFREDEEWYRHEKHGA